MKLPLDTAGHLATLADLGGYFALPVASGQPQWRSLPELFDTAVISGHVEATRSAIAAAAGCGPDRVPVRMAASSFQLGVAARLLSPVIGAAVCLHAVPVLDAATIRWRPSDTHAPLFAVAEPQWRPAGAAAIVDTVVPVLVDLGARLATLVSLSPQVSLGNIASASNGAVTVLAMSRPELEGAGRQLVRQLLQLDPLIGTGSFTGGQFRRNSCCLYYQGPGGGLCGDCVLVPGSTR
ncbi:(2Fe-2S)-binding protein [Mycobacterium sp. NPDC003323]